MCNKLIWILCFIYNIIFAVNVNNNVTAITNLKPNRYMGKWYEIARIPMYFEKNCIAPITAEYTMNQNGSVRVVNTCRSVADGYNSVDGIAYFSGPRNIAKLKVTFLPKWLRFISFAQADYWILYTDYNYALVGNPNHDYLWILSRKEDFEPHQITKLIDIAKQQGYNTKLLQFNYVYEALLK